MAKPVELIASLGWDSTRWEEMSYGREKSGFEVWTEPEFELYHGKKDLLFYLFLAQ